MPMKRKIANPEAPKRSNRSLTNPPRKIARIAQQKLRKARPAD